jgi:hypothetical protein
MNCKLPKDSKEAIYSEPISQFAFRHIVFQKFESIYKASPDIWPTKIECLLLLWCNSPTRARIASFSMFLNHTMTHDGRLLWTRDRSDAKTSTWQHISQETDIHAPAGFKPAIPERYRSQTLALNRSAIGIGKTDCHKNITQITTTTSLQTIWSCCCMQSNEGRRMD